MNVMITDVLNLSQVSMAAAPEQVLALDDIMEEAISLLEGEITRTRADLTVQGPLPRVLGNRTLLVQIFSNLIVNALKFARPGAKPQIRIYAVLNDGHCEIHVEDQGVGIPPEMLEKIFAAFERGSATEAVAGMGVGLAIVRTAAERLGEYPGREAAAAIVNESWLAEHPDVVAPVPLIAVEDTLRAYGDIAAAHPAAEG